MEVESGNSNSKLQCRSERKSWGACSDPPPFPYTYKNSTNMLMLSLFLGDRDVASMLLKIKERCWVRGETYEKKDDC
jgi:hypothetical protein